MEGGGIGLLTGAVFWGLLTPKSAGRQTHNSYESSTWLVNYLHLHLHYWNTLDLQTIMININNLQSQVQQTQTPKQGCTHQLVQWLEISCSRPLLPKI